MAPALSPSGPTPSLGPASSPLGKASDDPDLSPKEFGRIARIIRDEAGIHLGDAKTSLVYSRLVKRLRAVGLTSFASYCDLVSSAAGTAELQKMVEALTTNYTFFLREPHHFEHLRREVLPGLLAEAARGRRVRIWSAGCSMGHETYSIALSILAVAPDCGRHDVKILATDIDRNVLATARAGLYDEATLAVLSPADRQLGFLPPNEDGLFQVRPELRSLVTFRELNLLDEWPMNGQFDIVFFRNVAIYFDQPLRESLWSRMGQHIRPGGWLYAGHSERLTGPAAKLFTHEATTTYRRLPA
ncbi:CheR family methyltransferase [Aureimonas sp. AU40]|uniref:CheR family methyltransferase n=1 Tax=Aureimonas sp. AU40 TaxID=1637747 RepID=UPI0009E7EE41|nr:protein-glutamate O-methyltransferase [Aureimonas sp. AU40]